MQPDSRISFDYKPRSTSASAATHARWFISGLILPLLGGLLVYALTKTTVTYDQALRAPVIVPSMLPKLEPLDVATSLPPAVGDSIEFVVQRNDTLDRIFRTLKLNLTDLALIRDLPGVAERLDRLRCCLLLRPR